MDKREAILKICEEIEQQTARDVAYIELKNEKPGLTDSKLGGVPYLPEGGEFPVDDKGRQLKLLAQINLEDLEGMEDLPSKGLLQFFTFIDDVYGIDFEDFTNQNTFRIVYYEDINCDVKEEDLAEKYSPYFDEEDPCFPFEGEFKMEFEVDREGMSFWDYRYDDLFVQKYNEVFPDDTIDTILDVEEMEDIEDEDFFDELMDELGGNGNKVGGYPAFTQEDPRGYDYEGYDTLLLQIDTIDDDDEDIHIMWGDSGVCNFFIDREKLRNRDFSDVIYNWDCY